MIKDVQTLFEQQGVHFSGGGNYPNLMGYCPLHGEVPGSSKPSFCANVETGAWICFAGCGAGGLPQFLKAKGHDRAIIGSTLKKIDYASLKKNAPKKKAREPVFLPEAVLGLWDYCPHELLRDGFDPDVLQDNDVGYDPERNRITYPVRDINGSLLAVVGRRENTSYGKYVPYSAKELKKLGVKLVPEYRKGETLYRGHIVYPSMYFSTNRQEKVYVVEGFKAALWMVQNGYPNTVAIMGSTLTDTQASLLRKMGKTVILCLDGDAAGLKGTEKSGIKLIDALRVLTCKYPENKKQPDDLSNLELRQMIEGAVPLSKNNKRTKTKNYYNRRT